MRRENEFANGRRPVADAGGKPLAARVTAWGDGLVGLLEKHVHKGDLILVTDQNRTRKYTKDGADHYATEVVMGPNDQVKFLDVKGKAKGDGHPPATETDDDVPYRSPAGLVRYKPGGSLPFAEFV